MTLDTVALAATTPDTDQPYAELGLKPDEYDRIREILGRRPTSSKAGHVFGHVERALLLQVQQGALAPVRRQGAAVRRPARRYR